MTSSQDSWRLIKRGAGAAVSAGASLTSAAVFLVVAKIPLEKNI
jgi:hypothetical protein